MNNFKSTIFNYLTNRHGFVMVSYINTYTGLSNWVAIKHLPEGDYAVIITDDINNSNDTQGCINYLNTTGRKYSFNKIILSQSGIIDNFDSYSKVIFDERNNVIIYCDNNCKVLEKIINSILNESRRSTYSNKSMGNILKDSSMHITLTIIAINIAMFLISVLMSRNIMNIDVETLVRLGGKVGVFVKAGEYWRLLTCMFLHGGLIHIAFNMYALYAIGPQIERVYGKGKYLGIYFGAGLASSIFSYIFGSPWIVSIGASGAIFGLFGALLVFAIKEKDRIQRGALNNLVFIVGLNLVIGFSSSNIDNFAHIGGLVFGAILSFIFLIIRDR